MAHYSKSVYYALAALVFGFILLIILISANYLLQKRNSPVSINERVENILHTKETYAKETLKNYEYNIFNANAKKINTDNRPWPSIRKNGIAIQYYVNDSLVSWSDNTVEELNLSQISKTESIQKLQNGWYDVILEKKGNTITACLILLKYEYSFENEYLENSFQKDFGIEGTIGISSASSGIPINSLAGISLFSLDFSSYSPSYDEFSLFLTFLLVLIYLSFYLSLYFSFSVIRFFLRKPWIFILCFIATAMLMRYAQFLFHFPFVLYSTAFFSPFYYSSSILLPSLGDYFLNGLIISGLSFLVFKKLGCIESSAKQKKFRKIFSVVIVVALILSLYLSICLGLEDLVKNSSFSLDLKDISKIGIHSIVGLLIIYSLLLSFYFLSRTAISYMSGNTFSFRIVITIISSLIVFAVVFYWKDFTIAVVLAVLFLAYLVILLFYFREQTSRKPFSNFVIPVACMALLATAVLNFAVSSREKEERKLIAVKLATEKNPITEVLYSKLERRLVNDSIIFRLVRNFSIEKEEVLIRRIKSEFIKDYWNKFTVQITVCTPGKMLRIQPRGYVFDCEQYFKQVCERMGEVSSNANLYHIDYGTGIETYLAVIQPEEFETDFKNGEVKIYMEFTAKTPAKDLGYPELLIDRRIMNIPDLGNYSYALYQRGTLVYKSGKFTYPVSFKDLSSFEGETGFANSSGMSHYRYAMDASRSLILSKKNDSFLGLISPASYLFILFLVLTLILKLICQPDVYREFSFITLKNRFQISNVGMIVVSFLILGCLLLYFLIRLNNLKNMDSFSERTMSVMTEMQERYGDKENFKKPDKAAIEEELQRLSGMFYTDVNVYYPYGKLMLSSRPQVFDEGLISDRMNSKAFADLQKNKQSAFFQDETIGLYKYTSAYFPLLNDKNELLAYINLPFFSHQEDLKKEINDFLVAFMNLYILFILLSVLTSLAISRYLSAPLGILVSRMEGFQLGKRNEKIIWNNQDEIGRLVNEYNRLIDELAFSADQLAASERESAWREMARQVAHEIKNPLTPMKLSVQHLKRAWEDDAGDFNLRIQRFTRIMTEQIDSLSEIATEFSDFAKMPLPLLEKIDLVEILGSVISLYSGIENIQISLEKNQSSTKIIGDRKQIVRVFTNLLNNATQAINSREFGIIRICINQSGEYHIIAVEDNGNGIPVEFADKIFLPNFTTKSGGTGLGLAIVRGIVRSMGGEVLFTSEKNHTVFTVKIPIMHEKI